MGYFEKITGKDISKEFKNFEIRAKKLPPDYQNAWNLIKENLWQYSDFTGHNLTPIFNNALDILEELAANGKSVQDSLGDDIKVFCAELVGEEYSNYFHYKCHKKLNENIAKKENKMKIQDMIKGKKEWRAHVSRVKSLPKDYQMVYKEIEKYIFKVSSIEPKESFSLLSDIVNFFEEGVLREKNVLEVTGNDVARFCDELIKNIKI